MAKREQRSLLLLQFSFFGLVLVLGARVVLSLYLNYRRLAKMPYMSTRYRQLLFRFYLLQASLVTTYYVLQYALGAHYIAQDNFGEQDLTELTDEVNTLFKQQTEQFGKGLFLAILAVLLAFVTYPQPFYLKVTLLVLIRLPSPSLRRRRRK